MTLPPQESALLGHFREAFQGAEPAILVRAPGRVNLLGEHLDYNGFPVLPVAIDRDIAVLASPRGDATVVLRNVDPAFPERTFLSSSPIPPFPSGDWGNYAKAVFEALAPQAALKNAGPLGLSALVSGSIPPAAGLSSSSALVVAVGVAISSLYALGLARLPLAELLASGERYVGTAGGGMDQAASLCGRAGHALKIGFFPLTVEEIPMGDDTAVLVCQSGVDSKKALGARAAYNTRVLECRLGAAMVAAFLSHPFSGPEGLLRPADLEKSPLSLDLEGALKVLPEVFPKETYTLAEIGTRLGTDTSRILALLPGVGETPSVASDLRPLKRLRHVFSEAMRVVEGERLLKAGALASFGALMDASHESCRGDYEVSCPELDHLVAEARRSGALGARLTGAGFGGSTVNLVERGRLEEFKARMRGGFYSGPFGRGLDPQAAIFECRPGDGARTVL